MMTDLIDPATKDYDGLRKSYDREAERYDELRYESEQGRLFHDMEIAVLRSWLPLARGAKILDLPAGTGRLSVAFPDSGALIIGGDISFGMLRMATAKAQEGGGARAQFTQTSGTQLPFADDTFDGVVSFKFFHLIPNGKKRAFIREMARVLKPGKPLVVEFNSPFYGGVLAFARYYFRKKHPGGMRMKCLFPDQVPVLFEGLDVVRKAGVKLPFAEKIQPFIGRRATQALNLWFGRIPVLRYLSYAMIIEARKPAVGASPGQFRS